jgi:hypothetical protein
MPKVTDGHRVTGTWHFCNMLLRETYLAECFYRVWFGRGRGQTCSRCARRQSYIETAFNVQRRIADWHFARARTWADLVAAHDRFVGDYNAQPHWAHRERPDGRRSPSEILGWVSGVRYRPEELQHAFFAARFSRILDAAGYVRFRDWRIYGEEGVARQEAALWLHEKTLTVEHRGLPLSRYDVKYAPGAAGKLAAVAGPRLFAAPLAVPPLMLFALDSLGEGGWLKALKLDGYAPRSALRRPPQALQGALFAR